MDGPGYPGPALAPPNGQRDSNPRPAITRTTTTYPRTSCGMRLDGTLPNNTSRLIGSA